MPMNPKETTNKIRSDYKEYISSILSVRDKEINQLAQQAVSKAEFVKGPYLETTLPFVKGKSLKELAEEGLVSEEFGKMGKSVHYDEWKLHIHQEKALRKIIAEDRNMVVSTGTGSGKTECYLYPIFNSLMREKENGTLDAGVRALLIFPMNALANDQQKKLRKLLKDYPDITFGRYTGETEHRKKKETPQQAEKRMHDDYDINHSDDDDIDLRKSIPNEMMCREMMAEKPPHLLLTNYAMLEYMLLQPDTAPFFDNSSAKNWRFIVIDEAHTYKGANGTEIAFLLRRLKERIRHNMNQDFRCIATSATLGDLKAMPALAKFAENLFGEPFEVQDIITTQRLKRTVSPKAEPLTPDKYFELRETVSNFSEEGKGLFLYNSLVNDPRIIRLYSALEGKPKRIAEVADFVFADVPGRQERENALITLIELSAAARRSDNESALLPARYHLFVKSLEGMFVQYYPSKAVFLDRREKVIQNGSTYSVFELANCQKCKQEYLIGKRILVGDSEYFIQTGSEDKPEFYFISDAEPVDLESFDEDDAVEEADKFKGLEKFRLCLSCGKIASASEKFDSDCCPVNDKNKIVDVYKIEYTGKDGQSNCCPVCGARSKGLIKRFLTANQPATYAVAKSLYDAIPPRPWKGKKEVDDLWDEGIFGDTDEDENTPAVSQEIIDETGRKLLIFSDNRQEAAFFAGFFEKKYKLNMWRKVILQCLKEEESKTIKISDLINRAKIYADKHGLYSENLRDKKAKKMTDDEKKAEATRYIMQELINPNMDTGLEGLGYISIEPEMKTINKNPGVVGVEVSDIWNLLRYMMDTLRQKGAISFPDDVRVRAEDAFFEPRNFNGYFRQQGSEVVGRNHIYGFTPEKGHINKRLAIVKKLALNSGVSESDLDSTSLSSLQEVYKMILMLKKYGYIVVGQDKITAYQLNHSKWNFRYIDNNDYVYRCKNCGKIYSYSLKDLCPEMKCNGKLEKVRAKDVRRVPYYSNLFEDDKFIPMVAREHTAQLSSTAASEYQKHFEDGRINVLSCSTTFEMGVDVGELEATFQRNVPPETSNYIQRAGRAGRRTSSAAFSVTFSRRNSHDLTFFNNPPRIISGKINAPILEISNEKIAERHLNSIVVAWFFKRHPEFFKGKTEKIVSFGDDANNMSVALLEELSKKPQDLLDSIHNALPQDICDRLNVDKWEFVDDIVGKEGSLTRAIEERCSDINGLTQYKDELKDEKTKHGNVYAAEKLIDTLEDEPSINFLSSKGVLPKYGFPIDTVKLDILSGGKVEADKIDLQRDLKMAISEFAPPAQIVANGKVWNSYAINTVPNKSWPTYIYYECPNCKRITAPLENMVEVNFDLSDVEKKKCTHCNTLMNAKKFIIPKFGFSTKMGDMPKAVGESKPSKYYATQTQFWGIDNLTEKQQSERTESSIILKGKCVDVLYSPGGKLFVLNQGVSRRGIYVCPQCGYATDTPIKGKHDTKYGRRCSNRSLVKMSLGHEFSTDIMKLTLPEHRVNIDMPIGTSAKNQELSVLYAILEGASVALGISRDDISGCLTDKNEIIIFDDTAGGSGFVKKISENLETVFRTAKEKVSGVCGCTEETSCYGCLRNYSNQHQHDELSRGLAYRYLDWLISSEGVDTAESQKDIPPLKTEEAIGTKKSNYEISTNPSISDTVLRLEDIQKEKGENVAVSSILDIIKDIRVEDALLQEPIDVSVRVWPELVWPKSHVAVFWPENIKQYNILKKYDWYCYLLDENMNIDNFIKHIRKD